MEPSSILAIVYIIAASVALAAVAAAEAAIERANDVRIQALAAKGNRNAQRIAGDVGNPGRFLGPLTSARVLVAASIVGVFAYIGAREYSPFSGGFGFSMLGGVYVAFIQMALSLFVARSPEVAALQMSGVARATSLIFGVPAFVLGLPARLVARSIHAVASDPDTDILSMIEREEAQGGVEEQERRMQPSEDHVLVVARVADDCRASRRARQVFEQAAVLDEELDSSERLS